MRVSPSGPAGGGEGSIEGAGVDSLLQCTPGHRREAREVQASLIVAGSDGRGSSRRFLGDTAEAAIALAPFSILTVAADRSKASPLSRPRFRRARAPAA